MSIEISNSPILSGVTRKIRVTHRNEDYELSLVSLVCKKEHYNATGGRIVELEQLERDPFVIVSTGEESTNEEIVLQADLEGLFL